MRSPVQPVLPPLLRDSAASRAQASANGFLLPPAAPPVCGIPQANPPRPGVLIATTQIGTPRMAVTFAPFAGRAVTREAAANSLRASVLRFGDPATPVMNRQRISHAPRFTGFCPQQAHAALLPPARHKPHGPAVIFNNGYRLQPNLWSRPTGRWA